MKNKQLMQLMMFCSFFIAYAVESAALVEEKTPGAAKDFRELGRTCTKLFYEGKIDDIWSRFGKQMKSAISSAEQLKAFHSQVSQQLGAEKSTIDEKVTKHGELSTYVRVARFEKHAGTIEVVWAFDREGTIEGFFIRPAQVPAESPHLEYKTKTPLRLPFDGTWHVFWGGRTIDQNYHAVSADQRFAYDLLIFKDGKSHSGEGKKNEDYYCFGQTIRAPATGIVVAVLDGVPDNAPGAMNPSQAMGNHVVIEHGNGEFSFLAHLQNGTVKVSKDQKVSAGDLLGLCGNSGNSSEPHLHYHLQTTGIFGAGLGLPAQFRDYSADGKPVTVGEPVKGENIQTRTSNAP